jgi:hypothetical protein
MDDQMTATKQKTTKRDLLVEYIRANQSAQQAEIRDAMLKQHKITRVGSSDISEARRKLGLLPPRTIRPITLDDVQSVVDVPGILGVSLKETIEICELLDRRSLETGGLKRMTDCLKALSKFQSVM